MSSIYTGVVCVWAKAKGIILAIRLSYHIYLTGVHCMHLVLGDYSKFKFSQYIRKGIYEKKDSKPRRHYESSLTWLIIMSPKDDTINCR